MKIPRFAHIQLFCGSLLVNMYIEYMIEYEISSCPKIGKNKWNSRPQKLHISRSTKTCWKDYFIVVHDDI